MFKKKNKVEYSHHDGKTFKTSIKITGAKIAPVGIAAEYGYVASKLGVEGIDWELVQQTLIHGENDDFDILEIKTKNGTFKTYHFNISDFYGKY